MSNLTQLETKQTKKFGVVTRALAGVCHDCSICTFGERHPKTTFGKVMRWHRKWCPAWAAHTKVYGKKPLS